MIALLGGIAAALYLAGLAASLRPCRCQRFRAVPAWRTGR